jgi:NAD+ synthase (glutamine-hydrolysing)
VNSVDSIAMKIALAQINPTVGDIAGNAELIRWTSRRAAEAGADLAVFSELALVGYPPKDLLLKEHFIDDNLTAMEELAAESRNISLLVGYVCRHTGATGRELHNAAALLRDGKIAATYYKQLLPTYDVFDETRYFEPARSVQVVPFGNSRLGLTICEDIWQLRNTHARPLYELKPLAELKAADVDVVINLSASPFYAGKHDIRRQLFGQECARYGLPLIYVNQIGGNDELVFDGCSCVFDRHGEVIAQGKDFEEDLLVVDWDNPALARRETPRQESAAVHAALVLGLRDYVRKCGFRSVVLGLSGGVDSAVTAALAVAALGPRQVFGVAMPSRYSSEHSLADARQLAANLGIQLLVIPIEPVHQAMEGILAEPFAGRQPDITEENIQARIRGNILMALSNKFGHLLLSTGNKSELAVGYCTMYGDMAGGLAVISDVPKTMVYELADYINREREIIPRSTITKPPSAELKPNQVDQDSLPPYDQLDEILQRYIEKEESPDDVVAAGFDRVMVERVITMVDRNEYKRKQAAPGLKVTSRAFGFGRRMPIAQNYRIFR